MHYISKSSRCMVLQYSSLKPTCWDADTPDFEGRGETVPIPYFFQNLAEAEYVVTLYQYMRLLGYSADKISMLTTYNGQKALLKDVVERRCAHHPAFGVPHKVPLLADAPPRFAHMCCAIMRSLYPCCDLQI